MSSGNLTKMTIEAYKETDLSGTPADTFEVMFNPDSYGQKYEFEYSDAQGQGDTAAEQKYSGTKPQEFSFDFVFDGTGTAVDKVDVKETVDRFVSVCGEQQGEIHRPYTLKLSWGTLLIGCVLKSADVTYTLFDPEGTPLRAKVKALFAETKEAQLRVAEEGKQSPDLTHIRTVNQGEHLSLLSDRMYGDPVYYLQIAAVNGLTNFRSLAVGGQLIYPPVGESAG